MAAGQPERYVPRGRTTPPTGLLINSFTIPRGQAVLAEGQVGAKAAKLPVAASRGSTRPGSVNRPMLAPGAELTESVSKQYTTLPPEALKQAERFDDRNVQVIAVC